MWATLITCSTARPFSRQCNWCGGFRLFTVVMVKHPNMSQKAFHFTQFDDQLFTLSSLLLLHLYIYLHIYKFIYNEALPDSFHTELNGKPVDEYFSPVCLFLDIACCIYYFIRWVRWWSVWASWNLDECVLLSMTRVCVFVCKCDDLRREFMGLNAHEQSGASVHCPFFVFSAAIEMMTMMMSSGF